MARKKYEEEHENHERWLVSYADFITLLFAFFVVMYAISSVNESKYRVLSDSLGNAFGQTKTQPKSVTPPPIMPLPSKTLIHKPRTTEAVRRERDQMTGIARNILKVLAPLVSEGKVRVTQTAWGVSVEINASLLFSLGEAKLTDESSQALKAVAEVLKNDQHAIRVEGYTDDLPISNVMFPSNWELSAMRASSVVRLFGDNGIAENRLTAVGHGSNEPVDTNATTEGRARNRRVTVTILSALPEVVTEVPVSTNPKN